METAPESLETQPVDQAMNVAPLRDLTAGATATAHSITHQLVPTAYVGAKEKAGELRHRTGNDRETSEE